MSQSIVLMDGFDNYQGSAYGQRGWNGGDGPTAVTGRYGGFAMSLGAGNNPFMDRSFPSSLTTIVVGFAFKAGTAFRVDDFLKFYDNSANVLFSLRFSAANKIELRSASGTLLATGSVAFVNSTWYFIEARFVIAGASSVAEVHVNNVVDIASATFNFGTSAAAVKLRIGYSGFTANATTVFDDLRVGDGTTGSMANFPGDTRIETVAASANGADTDWTPSTGVNHAANVDEMSGTYPNGDTDYNSTSVAGNKDTFDMAAMAANAGSVYAIQPIVSARMDDAGPRTIAPVVRHLGVDYDGTTQGISASYLMYGQIYTAMPNGDPLTKARVEAAEYGVKLVS